MYDGLTLGNIVAGNCYWLQCFLVYDSDVSVLRVSGNCFPRIDNLSIPGNMFPRTSKGRQICDVAERRSQSAVPFDAYSRGDRGAATKVRVSWSGEMSSAEESIKEWRKFGHERVERLIALLEERRQNKSLYHPTTPAWHYSYG